MTARLRLHHLLDFAIEFFKKSHPNSVPDVQIDYHADRLSLTLALRERDREVARPVILRALGNVLASSEDLPLRQEAATYLGQHWDYFEDDSTVVCTLTAALFDSADSVQHIAVDALGTMGRAATSAIPAIKAIQSRSNTAELSTAIDLALRRIEGSGTA